MNKPYDMNQELVAMKHDIADRTYGIKMKELAITGLGLAGGVALGVLAAPGLAAAGMTTAMAAVMGGGLGMAGGGAVASIVTMKDRERLKIDEEMVNSYMSGKNYWGEGYREEVAEYGHSLGSPFPGQQPPYHDPGRSRE